MKSTVISLTTCLLLSTGLVAADPAPRLGYAFSASNDPSSPPSIANSKRDARLGFAYSPDNPTAPSSSPDKRSASTFFERRKRAPASSSHGFINIASPDNTHRFATVSISRRAIPHDERGVHPMLYFQQHANHAHRRYARLVGEREPSVEEQVERLRKRAGEVGWEIVERDTAGNQNGVRLRKRACVEENVKANVDAASNAAGFPQAAVNALSGNSVTPPTNPTANQSLGLNIEANDVGYFAQVQIGTPPQKFNMVLDTGSADMWVPSQACKNSDTGASTCAHTTLGTKSSSSFKASQNNFQVTYGTGNVQGVIAQDDVNIAGLALKAHTFGVTTSESNDFAAQNVPFDGLMGLAKSTLSNQKVLTPIEALAKNGAITSAQMGFTLGRVSSQQNTGEATFGGIDQGKFDGGLTTFANVNAQGFWEGAMDDVSVDGKGLNMTGRTAILDTGTSLMVAPAQDVAAVHAAIPGSKQDAQSGTFTIPCTSQSKVQLAFAGKQFDINPVDLAFAPVDPNNLKGDCVSGLMAGQIGGPQQWLVGDVFLKNVYFATSVNDNQIGLAPIKGN